MASYPKKTFTGLALTAAAVTLVSCSGGAASSAGGEEQVTLRTSTLFGPDNWQTQSIQAFADAIEENSDGSVTLEFYYGDALVAPGEYASALGNGTLDIAYTLLSYTPDVFPVGNWISSAAFLHDPSPDAGSLQGAAATLDWAFSDEDYMAQFEAAGIQPLLPRLLAHDSYSLLCTDPATTLDEVAGKRVRVAGAAWSAEAENLGMVPVDLPAAETYTSFQQGVIDCFMGGATDVDSLGLGELGKNFTATGLTGYDSASLLMSEQAWNDLSVEQQQAIWDALPVLLEGWFTGYREAEFAFAANAADQGVVVSAPDSAMRSRIDSHHDSVLEEMVAGAPADVTDPEAALANFQQITADWAVRLTDLGYSMEDATWSDLAERLGGQPNDLGPWAEAVTAEILDAHRPE
ncbi:TRAP transporter substrate-binding protein DctP [Microbacterium esteraromaticum]|uniref:TRAP transporter substrate-binding protein DctP n=1 Tax=Microbacterium esteraromaticum TaxID=57043 RepID=UPI001CD7B7D7|nr:TRAP transporter substrate-binding protein DctP [Microbacterium esteraromaticum]MCA1307849.1 TRAP transporter substrate-binding protein DctP [Microbacterium esteraromaticum]